MAFPWRILYQLRLTLHWYLPFGVHSDESDGAISHTRPYEFDFFVVRVWFLKVLLSYVTGQVLMEPILTVLHSGDEEVRYQRSTCKPNGPGSDNNISDTDDAGSYVCVPKNVKRLVEASPTELPCSPFLVFRSNSEMVSIYIFLIATRFHLIANIDCPHELSDVKTRKLMCFHKQPDKLRK